MRRGGMSQLGSLTPPTLAMPTWMARTYPDRQRPGASGQLDNAATEPGLKIGTDIDSAVGVQSVRLLTGSAPFEGDVKKEGKAWTSC
jgi:hypothetical protein